MNNPVKINYNIKEQTIGKPRINRKYHRLDRRSIIADGLLAYIKWKNNREIICLSRVQLTWKLWVYC